MENHAPKGLGSLTTAVAVLVVCLGSVVLYILSLGPAFRLTAQDRLPLRVYQALYNPLFAVEDHFPPLDAFTTYWTGVWRPIPSDDGSATQGNID